MLNRRHFLSTLIAAASAPLFAADSDESLPPVRAITRGPKFHWRGYYDKLLFDPSNRYVVANEVDFEHRTPKPDDVLRVGMIDTEDGDKWIELGTTCAWNWQQGCMLQWLPGDRREVLWNDRDGDRFIGHILDVTSGRRRTLSHPIYCVSPDGRWGLTPDFRRLNDCRPGYGYAGIPDPHAHQNTPEQTGIWRVDLATGDAKLLLSYAQIAAFPYRSDAKLQFDPTKSKHWFNHLLVSPDGSRFLFLHRWREQRADMTREQIATTGFSTRMFTADADGSRLHVVDPFGRTSHFVWRDPEHICAWAWHPSHNDRFYLYRDRSDDVQVVGPDVMTLNGHNTYVPNTNDEWILNDTYPDKQRLQHPYLFHVPTGRRVPLGHFHSPAEYKSEWRCDNHPCASRDGKKVVLDSPHGGNGRQVYLIDIAKIVS